MPILRGFVQRPQRVWLRRVNFQIHLWAGLALAVYLIVIGLTGSVLVFREELEAPNAFANAAGTAGPYADPAAVIDRVRAVAPEARLISLVAPSESNPVYLVRLQARGRNPGAGTIAVHPVTGAILGRTSGRAAPQRAWLGVVRNLHETLLLGVTGRQINGILAALLLAINVTGMVIWWPGLKTWPRALTVDLARTWRRINFDLHRAAGFWTFAIVSFWAISGAYFGFSKETRTLVERLSPLVSAMPPAVRVTPSDAGPADLRAMLHEAVVRDPRARLRGIAFPSGRRAPLEIAMQRPGTQGAEFADTFYFDPYTGNCLAVWRYGVNQSLGDWLIWLQIPLHFGTFWGLGVKILWAACGLAIPLLCVTGALMYWNRVLRRFVQRRFGQRRT